MYNKFNKGNYLKEKIAKHMEIRLQTNGKEWNCMNILGGWVLGNLETGLPT